MRADKDVFNKTLNKVNPIVCIPDWEVIPDGQFDARRNDNQESSKMWFYTNSII